MNGVLIRGHRRCNQLQSVRPLPAMIGVLFRGHQRCNQLQSVRPLPGRIGVLIRGHQRCNQLQSVRPLPGRIGVLIRGHQRCNQLQSARRPLPGRIGQRPSVRPRAHPRPSDALVGHLRQAVPLRPRRHSARERETDRESSLRETGRKRGIEGEGGRGREQTSRAEIFR
jgi:hypothetical protein